MVISGSFNVDERGRSSIEHKLDILERKFDAVINHADILVFECDLKKRVMKVTSNLSSNLLFASDYSCPLDEFMALDYVFEADKAIFKTVADRLKTVRSTFANIRIKDDGGEYYLCEAYFYGVYDKKGVLTDIAGSVRPSEAFDGRTDENTDDLTGLMVPEAFYRRMGEILRSFHDRRFVMIVLDIASFKYINQLHGTDVADNVLQFIAFNLKNIQGCKRSLICRFEGDRFGIFTCYHDDSTILELIGKVEESVSFYRSIPLKYSFGVYRVESALVPPRVICDCANIAKDSVKDNRLKNVAFYDDSMRDKMIEDINIENEMERALAEGQFEMFLQPKYNISSGCVIGAEALVRWRHPHKGLINPDSFIPLFEKNGFITRLDECIWEQACRFIRSRLDEGSAPMPVSVNVSRVDISDPNIIKRLNALVESFGIEKRFLELEITETVYYDDQPGLLDSLYRMKEAGYTLLMDDFGSGFSSLSMLKDTPFDVLKIDRNFLNESMITERGKKIVRHIISLANDINLDIVAEGIETKEQAQFLLECGCRKAQGYYYSKPVTVSDFRGLIGFGRYNAV